MGYACARRLNHEAHRLSDDRGETFDAKHVEIFRQRRNARGKRRRIDHFAHRHDERIEVVMIVIFLSVVMRASIGDIVLGADAKAKQQRLIDLAVGGGDHLDAPRQHLGDRSARLFDAGRIDQIALVENNEVGASDLVLKNFFDRIVVRQRAVGRALLRQCVEIVRHASIGERGYALHQH